MFKSTDVEAQGFYKAELSISGDLDLASPILIRETGIFLHDMPKKFL